MRARIHEEVNAFAGIIRAQLHNGCLQLQRKLLHDEEWSMEAPSPRAVWKAVFVSTVGGCIARRQLQYMMLFVCFVFCAVSLWGLHSVVER